MALAPSHWTTTSIASRYNNPAPLRGLVATRARVFLPAGSSRQRGGRMRRAHLQTRQGGQNTVVGCAVRTFKHQWCAQRTLRLGKARKSRRSPHLGGPGLLYLEATDTTAGAFSGDEHYNTGFAYGTYQTGWRYRDRPLASTWGRCPGGDPGHARYPPGRRNSRYHDFPCELQSGC